MTQLQEKLLQLLTDLDEICQRENIRYYLCEETAHGAVVQNAFHPMCCQANVAMTVEDMRKFMAAVEKEDRADRTVDSMLTNKTYPDFTVRYCDLGTTMIHMPFSPKGALPCIGVTIYPIRYKNAAGMKRYKLTRKFWECSVKTSTGSFVKKAVVFACRAVCAVLGRGNVSRWLFNQWCKIFAGKAKTFAVGVSKYVFSKSCLKQPQSVVLEGKAFPIFADVEDYLNKRYNCHDFREKKPHYEKETMQLLVSCCVPYEKYLQRAQELGIDFKAVYKNYSKYEKLHQTVSGENKTISKYYAIVDRTQKRFEMYERYMPIKKLLVQLYQQERYEELNTILMPYRKALRACQKKGLGLCFDKEIFDMTMDLLQREDRGAYVKKLRALVPKQHWQSMVVTDYKGQLVEITELDQLPPEYLSNVEDLQND